MPFERDDASMHTKTMSSAFFFEQLPTPIGDALIITDALDRLRAVDWTDHRPRLLRLLQLHYGDASPMAGRERPSTAFAALAAYFAGDLAAIDRLEVETAGTSFQRRVWAALRTIPPGAPISYAQLAERIDQPRAVRAVGLANGANPVGIVVPCHRVIGSDGSLTGYGGGLERKRWLLAHEGAPRMKVSDARRADGSRWSGPRAVVPPPLA